MRHVLSGIIIILPCVAFAETELASRIDHVTVFPDAAVVTRAASVDLAAGPSTLILRGLPANIDPASIRVEGQGTSAFLIGSVDVRAIPGDARPVVDHQLETKLRQLREERERVQGRIASLEGKKGMIERYASATPEKLGIEAKPLDVGQWAAAWSVVGDGLTQTNEELRALRLRGAELDAEVTALERARPQPVRPGAPKRDVLVAVEAAGPTAGELRLSYRVTGAGWSAIYDARLETGAREQKPSLEIVRRAQVVQRTGEDWDNVLLSVSTVRVSRSAAPPDLPPLQVSFYEPPIAAVGDAVRRLERPAAEALLDGRRQDRSTTLLEGEQAKEQTTQVEATAFQATFHVPGRVTVAQDGATKNFVLNRRSVAPSLSVKSAPVLDETAYLEASFKNEDDAPLLPGEVSLHRDNSFVGRARLKLVPSGETVNLGFGADDQVKITRVPLRRNESEASWIGQTKSDIREFKTTVKNLHREPIRITVVDRAPFSENSSISTEVLRDITPPSERQPENKRGVVTWTSEYAPGEQKEIKFGYLLKWPADKALTFQPRPVAPN